MANVTILYHSRVWMVQTDMGVPVINIEGSMVVGFDQPRLAQLLGL